MFERPELRGRSFQFLDDRVQSLDLTVRQPGRVKRQDLGPPPARPAPRLRRMSRRRMSRKRDPGLVGWGTPDRYLTRAPGAALGDADQVVGLSGGHSPVQRRALLQATPHPLGQRPEIGLIGALAVGRAGGARNVLVHQGAAQIVDA